MHPGREPILKITASRIEWKYRYVNMDKLGIIKQNRKTYNRPRSQQNVGRSALENHRVIVRGQGSKFDIENSS